MSVRGVEHRLQRPSVRMPMTSGTGLHVLLRFQVGLSEPAQAPSAAEGKRSSRPLRPEQFSFRSALSLPLVSRSPSEVLLPSPFHTAAL